ncbi:hypothetical protein QDQ39_00920 [Providencia rettgeri]|nr:hypothetical protein [Providencia rettgeri]
MRDKNDCLTTKLMTGFITVISLSVLYYICSQIWVSDSETSSKLANIFSFISSLGIIATIAVYLFQNNRSDKKEKLAAEKHNESHRKVVMKEGDKIKISLLQFKDACEKISENNFHAVIAGKYPFYFIKTRKEEVELPLLLRDNTVIRDMYISSSHCTDVNVYDTASVLHEINMYIENQWNGFLFFGEEVDNDCIATISSKAEAYIKAIDFNTPLKGIEIMLNRINTDNPVDEDKYVDVKRNEDGTVTFTIKNN